MPGSEFRTYADWTCTTAAVCRSAMTAALVRAGRASEDVAELHLERGLGGLSQRAVRLYSVAWSRARVGLYGFEAVKDYMQ